MKQRIRVFRWLAAGWAIVGMAGVTLWAVPTSTATFTTTTTPTLRINEVLAANTLIRNGDTLPDIIELFNAGTSPITLAGKRLADATATTPFEFPPTTPPLAPGVYLLVYADSETAQPGIHTGFSLDAEGDEVRLLESTANGGGVIDSIKFGFQVANLSISRTGAAANVWALTAPTLGSANGSALPLAGPEALRLNEWAGKVTFRLDHDMIELFNTAAQPVALGGVGLTDDTARPRQFTIPGLSFIGTGTNAFLPLYGADFVFKIDGDSEVLSIFGENSELIDRVTIVGQQNDRTAGRVPDGSANIVLDLPNPSPGLSNQTAFPSRFTDLMNGLRITEVMYQPAAPSNSSDYEYVELHNIGATTLDLNGVRFTNGIQHTFRAGETLAPGAFIVVANDRSSFLSRYPGLTPLMAQGGYNGSLNNSGDVIALTLPAPWDVHILNFRYDNTWFDAASGGGRSLVVPNPAATPAASWGQRSTWRASAAVNGSPGFADAGSATGGGTTSSRLANLSVRTAMAAGQNLIVGFVVSGGSRNILVRAAGPGLTALGLAGAMADPRLDLYSGSNVVFSNNDWPASLASVFTSVAAFPFANGSRDAAFVQAITNGSVHTQGTGAGIVLVEGYDTGGDAAARLVNVSARNRVGTDADILIAGFNISGTSSKQLLIRAVGPKLTTFGVSGVLIDPRLEVFSGSTRIAENDNWSSTLAATFTAVGAFALDAGSRDAALLTTLDPGSYTVQVSGVAGGTGEALVEIYEVP